MVPPVATEPVDTTTTAFVTKKLEKVSFNPFYSNIPSEETNDNYEHAKYKVSLTTLPVQSQYSQLVHR